MNLKWYNVTRKNPIRIKATDEGKELIRSFTRTIIERGKVEHPETDYNNKNNVIISVVFFFIKYLIEYMIDLKTDKNSAIYVIAEMSNGETLFTHNLLNEKSKIVVSRTSLVITFYKLLKKLKGDK